MSIKSQSIGALFLALVVILGLNPKIINNIYENVLGRIFLICVVIFFSINNATLGLLVVLIIITALNQFGSFTEGFEINQSETESFYWSSEASAITIVFLMWKDKEIHIKSCAMLLSQS